MSSRRGEDRSETGRRRCAGMEGCNAECKSFERKEQLELRVWVEMDGRGKEAGQGHSAAQRLSHRNLASASLLLIYSSEDSTLTTLNFAIRIILGGWVRQKSPRFVAKAAGGPWTAKEDSQLFCRAMS